MPLSSDFLCAVRYLVYKRTVHHGEHHVLQETWPEAPRRHKPAEPQLPGEAAAPREPKERRDLRLG